MRYRARTRGYELGVIEGILRSSQERYYDTGTLRHVAIGAHGPRLVMIPYERFETSIIPMTIHAISRQQITARVKSGRFVYE